MAGERKLVEIDETEFLNLKGTHNVIQAMLQHPEASRLLLQARKVQDPNAKVIDPMAPMTAAVTEIKSEFAAWRKAQEEQTAARDAAEVTARFQQEWNDKKTVLREQGWRADGIAEVEKFAQERGIADLEAAAAYYEKLHPPAEPVTPNGYGSWDFFQAEGGDSKTYVDRLMEARGEDEGALRSEAGNALREYRASLVNQRR